MADLSGPSMIRSKVEQDVRGDQGFLTALAESSSAKNTTPRCVAVREDGLNLVNLLFTGGSCHVDGLILAARR